MKEHIKNIEKTAVIKLEGFPVEVTITNVKQVFGRIDYEICLNGVSKWVNSDRVQVQN